MVEYLFEEMTQDNFQGKFQDWRMTLQANRRVPLLIRSGGQHGQWISGDNATLTDGLNSTTSRELQRLTIDHVGRSKWYS